MQVSIFLKYIVAAVLGVAASCYILSTFDSVFVPPYIGEEGINGDPEYQREHDAGMLAANSKNGALEFGILGSVTGLFVGLIAVGGKSTPRAAGLSLVGGAVGGVVGGFIGGILLAKADALTGNPITIRGIFMDSMTQGALIQLVCWLGICLGLGGAIGLATGKIATGISSGFIAAIAATLAGVMVIATLYPGNSAFEIIPLDLTQSLIWAALTGLWIGLVFGYNFCKSPSPGKSNELAEGENQAPA